MAVARADVAVAAEEDDSFKLTVGDRLAFDDNLFRLPDDFDVSQSPSADGRRGDYINRLSLGLDADWAVSRQVFSVNARLDDNRFQRNDQLDNTAGVAKALWSWSAGSHWSGDLGADYSRSLASFANTRFLSKDLLETTGAFWSASYRVGPQWRLHAGARQSQTEHSADERRFDDSSTSSGTFGVDYRTSAGTVVGWDYRYSKGEFDRPVTLSGEPFDRSYHENVTRVTLTYELGAKTNLKASGGYLRREYPEALLSGVQKGTFSGSVWEATLNWAPTEKLGLELEGWRKLKAYLDAESDYFIARGFSVGPVWNATPRVRVTLGYTYESQDYLGSSVNLLVLEPRQDRVRGAEFGVTYKATRVLHFDLSGRTEKRSSDRQLLEYDDKLASFSIRLVY